MIQPTDQQKLTRAILVTAIKKLESGQYWTQGALARDLRGYEVEPNDPIAVRWCARGILMALEAEMRKGPYDPDMIPAITSPLYGPWAALTNVAPAIIKYTIRDIDRIEYVNDQLGHKAVMQMYQMALKL